MTRYTNRSCRRAVVAAAVALPFALGLLHAPTLPVEAQATGSNSAAVIRSWFDQRNQGDDRGAASLFAGTTYFVAAAPTLTCTAQAPCFDPESAWWSLQAAETGAHYCATVLSMQADGRTISGRYEERNDFRRARGIERTVATFTAEVQDGKIVSFQQWSDESDAQTAQNDAIAVGNAQAGTSLPTPDPACG
jgi:hypothetical protein